MVAAALKSLVQDLKRGFSSLLADRINTVTVLDRTLKKSSAGDKQKLDNKPQNFRTSTQVRNMIMDFFFPFLVCIVFCIKRTSDFNFFSPDFSPICNNLSV